MPNYGYNQGYISRGDGRNAVAAAAYYAAEDLTQRPHALGAAAYQAGEDQTADQRTFRFAHRKDDVLHAEIMAPEAAPDWVHDRASLWSQVEAGEKKVNARVARRLIISLQHELSFDQNLELLRGFLQERFVKMGAVVDLAIHKPTREQAEAGQGDERHIHAHILITRRPLTADGFGPHYGTPFRDAEQGRALYADRRAWEEHVNRAFEKAGLSERVSADSVFARGIVREPEIVLGDKAVEMQRGKRRRRQSEAAEAVNSARLDTVAQIRMRNQLRADLDRKGEPHPDWLMSYYRQARSRWMKRQEHRIGKVRARGNEGFATILEKQLDAAKQKACEIDRRYGVREERVERAGFGATGQERAAGESAARMHGSEAPDPAQDGARQRKERAHRFEGHGWGDRRSRSSVKTDRRGNRRDTGDNLWGIIDFFAAEARSTFGKPDKREREAQVPYPEQFPYHEEYDHRNPYGGSDPREREGAGKVDSPEEPGASPQEETRQQRQRRKQRRRRRL